MNVGIHIKCPFCGSHRTKTFGGENGDPFQRSPQKTVCLDCGMTVYDDAGLAELSEICRKPNVESEE